MRDFLSSVRFKILVALLTVLAGFMIMAIYTGGTAPLAAQLFSMITVPLQRTSAQVSDSVSGFFDKFLNAGQVYEQNKLLQDEVNTLRKQLVDYQAIQHENAQYKAILNVTEKRRDLAIETASVIARDPADRFYSFTIDKGTMHNISYLDPVMTADGLVGYVSEVGITYAKVITILDITLDVGAYDSATRDIGIVSGTIDLATQGLCQMEYLPRDSAAAKGDLVLTSGGSLFPKDIIIGSITSVQPGSHGTSLVATIQPAADISDVKNVFVITYFEGQGSE